VAVRTGKRAKAPEKRVEKRVSPQAREAIAEATADAVAPKPSTRGRSRRGRGRGPAEPVNEPLAFISFIADHQPGTEVEATVDSFTSHGAFVTSNGARCYVPLTGLGEPPPRSAKDVLNRGETRTFVVQALDPPRRGIELALPDVAKVAGVPTDETVEAEIAEPAPGRKKAAVKKKAAPAKKKAPAKKVEVAPKKAVAKKAAPAKKTTKKTTAPAKKKASAKKADVAPKKATKKAATKKTSKKKAAPPA
jgi:ribosomal protein S1